MILIDTNQIMMSSVLSQHNSKLLLEEDLIRHIILNSLRFHVKKFKTYGEVVLCCDSRTYWRKQAFPHYKAHRKSAREKSVLDWKVIFSAFSVIKQEIKDNFPYKVIEVDGAEADDIIGTLSPRISSYEPVIIVSSDSDFKQLHKYPNVKQYNPTLGVYVKSPNPIKELKEKIIRGDKGDGIPSILSNDDTFIVNKRQSPISKKKIEQWLEQPPEQFCLEEDMYRNYKRNDLLINFDNIPDNIRTKIIEEFDSIKPNSKQSLYKYLVTKKLTNLLDCIEDF